MNTQEQQLIDGLFKRLKDAEHQGEARDAQAEGHIQKCLSEHPAAPYYMAQVILIQEASLKQLDQRVRDLEAQVSQLKQTQTARPASTGGSFLSGLFGGGSSASSNAPVASAASSMSPTGQPVAPVNASAGRGWSEPGYRSSQPMAAAAPTSSGGGFLAGAVQTAVGVAGGMLLAETISGLFKDEAPATVVESIVTPEPSAPSFFQSDDAFAQPADFEEFDEGDDLFSGDDESFV